MGLLRHFQSTVKAGMSLEERWHAWIRDEKLRRLGWAIYVCDSPSVEDHVINPQQGNDSSICYLYNGRPCLSVTDIDMDLQSSTEQWEAESPQAWAALHPWTETGPQNIRFRPSMRGLYDRPEEVLRQLTEGHHQIPFILTLMRMLWTSKEIEASPLNNHEHCDSKLAKSNMEILDLIDRFLDPAEINAKNASPVAMYKAQTIHMAHLIGAGDIMDWLYSLLRPGPEADVARARMHRWALEDPPRVRQIAYHSAQVLAINRRFPHNSPAEPFNVFHAGAVLWCVAQLLSHSSQVSQAVNKSNQSAICQIDSLKASCDPEMVEVKTWVKNGGIRIVSLSGVPNLCAMEGRRQVLEQTAKVFDRMRVWGISQNFLKVIISLIANEE